MHAKTQVLFLILKKFRELNIKLSQPKQTKFLHFIRLNFAIRYTDALTTFLNYSTASMVAKRSGRLTDKNKSSILENILITNLICRTQILKSLLRLGVVFIFIWMPFHRQLSVSSFDLVFARVSRDAQNRVKIPPEKPQTEHKNRSNAKQEIE